MKAKEQEQRLLYDEFIDLQKDVVEREIITRDTSLQLIGLVDDGSMEIRVAVDRINRLIDSPKRKIF
jgi:hypothetical protein